MAAVAAAAATLTLTVRFSFVRVFVRAHSAWARSSSNPHRWAGCVGADAVRGHSACSGQWAEGASPPGKVSACGSGSRLRPLSLRSRFKSGPRNVERLRSSQFCTRVYIITAEIQPRLLGVLDLHREGLCARCHIRAPRMCMLEGCANAGVVGATRSASCAQSRRRRSGSAKTLTSSSVADWRRVIHQASFTNGRAQACHEPATRSL